MPPPLGLRHISMLGSYAFTIPEMVARLRIIVTRGAEIAERLKLAALPKRLKVARVLVSGRYLMSVAFTHFPASPEPSTH